MDKAGSTARGGVTSSLDLVRRAVGGVDGPEVVAGVQRLSDVQVADLAEAVCARLPQPQVVPGEGEAWPLITARASTFATTSGTRFSDAPGAAGLNLTAAMDPRFMGSGRFSTSVLQALLYCHGLVIEDPLAMAADLYTTSPAQVRAMARSFITAATVSLCEVAPLLDTGVVQTFFTPTADLPDIGQVRAQAREELDRPGASFGTPEVWEAFEASYVDGLSPSLRELWRLIRAGDRHPPLDLVEAGLREDDARVVETFIEVLSDLRPAAVVDNCLDIVLNSVAAQTRLGARHDLLCPTPLFAKLLFLGTDDPVHQLRLHELARLNVPGIADLLVEDAVRIRQTSDAFDQWRRSLSVALERAHTLRRQVGQVDTTAVVAETIADARAGLFRELGSSRALTLAGATSFAAGALGGVIGAATGGVAAVLLGAAGGLIPAVVQAVVDTRQRPPGHLRRHYLVFDKPQA
ncbi:MAG TPA: hypothetical protein VFC00_00215 [Micromonosporaceae bacterium]|nr:hypothetical protein [Micromonosporaceae bacterium]